MQSRGSAGWAVAIVGALLVAAIAVVGASGGRQAEAASSGFVGIAPERLLDTRSGRPTLDGLEQGEGALAAGETRSVPLAGRGSLPATGMVAVALNVTAAAASEASFVTVSPAGGVRPTASNLNTKPGGVVANMVVVPLGTGGAVDLFNRFGSVDLVIDVLGYFGDAAGFVGVSPERLLETRSGRPTLDGGEQGEGPVGEGETRAVPLAGRGSVPAVGVTAVALNVTAVGASAATFLTVFPTGGARPTASNLNSEQAGVVANMVVVPLGAGGAVDVFNRFGSVDVVIDVLGYFVAGSVFVGLSPERLLETRAGRATIDGFEQGAGALAEGETRTVPLAGRGSVPPSGAVAVALNVTAAGATAATFETVFPSGAQRPTASNLNPVVGGVTANMVVVPLGTGGAVDVFNRFGSVDVVIDVLGYFTAVDLVGPTTSTTVPGGTTTTVPGGTTTTVPGGTTTTVPGGTTTTVPGGSTTTVPGGTTTTIPGGTTTTTTTVAGPQPEPTTLLVSHRLDDLLHGGVAIRPVVSRNGRFVVFESGATNLYVGDTNAGSDVFVYDLENDTLELVSLTDGDTPVPGASTHPAISDDGRYVTFLTAAGALGAPDTNGAVDVYRRDRTAGTTELVSLRDDESQVLAVTSYAISGNADVVAFRTSHTVSNATVQDVLVRTVSAGTTESANLGVTNYGNPGSGVSVSQDGDKVALAKQATFTGNPFGIFRYDVSANTITNFSNLSSAGGSDQGSPQPVLSDDGAAVTYTRSGTVYVKLGTGIAEATVGSGASPRFAGATKDVVYETALALVAADTNATHDVYRRTTTAPPVTTLLSVKPLGGGAIELGADASFSGSMSTDESVIVFTTRAANFAEGINPDATTVVARTSKEVLALSVPPASSSAAGVSSGPAITPDGRYVVYESRAGDIDADDFDSVGDVYRYDRTDGTNVLVTPGAVAAAGAPAVSDDGNLVVFSAPELDDPDAVIRQVYVRDVAAGNTTPLSLAAVGGFANNNSLTPTISGDGTVAVWQSFATNLVAGDTNGRSDVFVRDLATDTTERVSLSAAGAQLTGPFDTFDMSPDVSADGRHVVWVSALANVVPEVTTGGVRVYRRDRTAATTELVAAGDNPSISADGRFVAFDSNTALEPGDTNAITDVYVKNLQTGALVRVTPAGGSDARISDDGRWVTFRSVAPGLVPGDADALANLFLYDRLAGAVVDRIDVADDGTPADHLPAGEAAPADGGRLIAFASEATNLVTGDKNARGDVFLRDRDTT
jgi:Tol biopolymer transport system component